MELRAIRRVVVEFADGEIQEFNLPDTSQGFYRERYTYNGVYDENGNFKKWTNRIFYHEIVWTLSEEEQNTHGRGKVPLPSEPTKLSTERSSIPYSSGNGTESIS